MSAALCHELSDSPVIQKLPANLVIGGFQMQEEWRWEIQPNRKETRMESGIQIEEGQRKRDLKHSPGAKSEANLAVLGAWSL